jgi:glucokinase
VIGVDLGGSNIRAVAVADGRIVVEAAEETRQGSAPAVIDQVAEVCRRLTDLGSVAAVAVGVPGVVRRGRIELAPNLPPFGDIDLPAALGELLGVPVRVDNDVNMATEAEHRHGHGRGVADFVFVAVGTGVGMGVVADGRLLRGSAGAAGEIAMLPLGEATLEELAGGAGIATRAGAPTAQDVFAAAAAGDREAAAIIDEQADALAHALLAVQAVLDPELVVFGGGIGSRVDVVARVQGRLARPLALRVSALGERAGAVGAAEVARTLVRETVDA